MKKYRTCIADKGFSTKARSQCTRSVLRMHKYSNQTLVSFSSAKQNNYVPLQNIAYEVFAFFLRGIGVAVARGNEASRKSY